jgi:hypothetical protein
MARVRTVATFECAAFNTTERRDYFLNDSCFGDDLAEWLIDELGARNIETDAAPAQDEFGWHFGFRKDEVDYTFAVTHRSAGAGRPPVWIGRIERKAGRFGKLLHGTARGIEPEAVLAIHSVLNSALLIHNLKWHYRRDFNANREDLGAPEPIALAH